MEIKKVGVVGCGLMGSGIAQVAAVAGYDTTVCEANRDLLAKGISVIEKGLERLVQKGAMTVAQRDQTRHRLVGTDRLQDLKDCDIVIEAIPENLELKREVWRTLDAVCKPEAIFASNTSALSVTELMAETRRPDRFIGLHFFNPVPVMKLIEVVRTIRTDQSVFETAVRFGQSVGKVPVRARDTGGFIVNRLLIPYLLDAVRAFEEGIGSISDIDSAMKLGCGHPMGPFTLCDFIGLDTVYFIANAMFEEFKERRFAPPPLLKRLVLAGDLGKKTRRGFLNWDDPGNPTPAV